MDNLIKDSINKEIDENIIIDIVLKMISYIIEKINNMSGNRPEMVFTIKHREKLRLSQLLLTLGSIFNVIKKKKNENYINDFIIKRKNIIEEITKNIIDIFSKTNL
jgi:hypothetical protein